MFVVLEKHLKNISILIFFKKKKKLNRAQANYDANPTDANANALDTAKKRGATAQRAGDLFYDAVKGAKDNGVAGKLLFFINKKM